MLVGTTLTCHVDVSTKTLSAPFRSPQTTFRPLANAGWEYMDEAGSNPTSRPVLTGEWPFNSG